MAAKFTTGVAVGILAAGVWTLRSEISLQVLSYTLCVFGGSIVALLIMALAAAGRE